VIEELDESDVAVLVAEHDAVRRIEYLAGVLRDARLVLLGFLGGLALAQFAYGFFQHLGMRHQIVLDDRLDVSLLGVGKTLRRCGRRRGAQDQREQAESKQALDERAERRHWQILSVKPVFRNLITRHDGFYAGFFRWRIFSCSFGRASAWR